GGGGGVVATPVRAPVAPPIAAPTAAPCPPPTAPPMAAPAPAPRSPPPTARCAGSYGLVQPAMDNSIPAPITPEAIDFFVIPFLLFKRDLKAGQLTKCQGSGGPVA